MEKIILLTLESLQDSAYFTKLPRGGPHVPEAAVHRASRRRRRIVFRAYECRVELCGPSRRGRHGGSHSCLPAVLVRHHRECDREAALCAHDEPDAETRSPNGE